MTGGEGCEKATLCEGGVGEVVGEGDKDGSEVGV